MGYSFGEGGISISPSFLLWKGHEIIEGLFISFLLIILEPSCLNLFRELEIIDKTFWTLFPGDGFLESSAPLISLKFPASTTPVATQVQDFPTFHIMDKHEKDQKGTWKGINEYLKIHQLGCNLHILRTLVCHSRGSKTAEWSERSQNLPLDKM